MKHLIFLALIGCGRVDVSDSKHEVSGETTVRVVVGVDVTPCNGREGAEYSQCVDDLIALAKLIAEQKGVQDGQD